MIRRSRMALIRCGLLSVLLISFGLCFSLVFGDFFLFGCLRLLLLSPLSCRARTDAESPLGGLPQDGRDKKEAVTESCYRYKNR